MEDIALTLEPDVLAARGGDRDAFTRLVDATRTTVCSIVLSVVRDVQLSEDVAQEAYLAAWASISKLENPRSFLPWLRELTRNHARTFIRGRSRFRARHAHVDPDHAMMAQAVDPAPGPLRSIIDEERRRVLAETIGELPDDAREIVTLFYRENSSVAHVARLLGITESAAKKRLQRARSSIKHGVLQRFAETARQTAPGASFTVAVAAGMGAALPSGASAATGAGAAATQSFLPKLVAGVFAGAAGIFGGLGGIYAGHRASVRRARDDEERRALRRNALAMGLILVAGMAGLLVGGALRSPAMVVGSYLGWVAGFAWCLFVSLPRITDRRRRLEIAEDPRASEQHRRERVRSIIGFAVGLTIGAIPVFAGVWRMLAAG